MAVERPRIPTEKREPAWRRACLAYRAWRQAGASDQQAHEAAVAAVQTVLPYRGRRLALRPRTALPTRPVIIPSGFGGVPSTLKSGVQTSGTTWTGGFLATDLALPHALPASRN